MRKLQNKSLEERAKVVGIDFASGPEDELASRERRVFAAERSLRENKMWIVALLSAIASIVSAAAAAISAWKS